MIRSRRVSKTGWRATAPHMVRKVGDTPTYTVLRFIHVDELPTFEAVRAAQTDRKRG